MLNNINNHELVQEWKLNLDAAAYEKKIDSKVNRSSYKKEIDRHNSERYWPISIKETIQCFTLLSIMEHTQVSLKHIYQ